MDRQQTQPRSGKRYSGAQRRFPQPRPNGHCGGTHVLVGPGPRGAIENCGGCPDCCP